MAKFKLSLGFFVFWGFLGALYFILPAYQQSNMARIMILACLACAYNIGYGYAGLLSLGHAMFFAAGMYSFAFALLAHDMSVPEALIFATASGAIFGAMVGLAALRTKGVAFMIVTLMFAQAVYFAIIYFGIYTGADQGFNIAPELRQFFNFNPTDNSTRYFFAYSLLTCVMALKIGLLRLPLGKIWQALRENSLRAELCGYHVYFYRLIALTISAAVSALAGASYALLFGYVGASFAETAYSILPLLWVLVGGVGTIIGPFVGTLVVSYAIDIASEFTSAYWLIVGVMLVLIALWGRGGIVGRLQKRGLAWIP